MFGEGTCIFSSAPEGTTFWIFFLVVFVFLLLLHHGCMSCIIDSNLKFCTHFTSRWCISYFSPLHAKIIPIIALTWQTLFEIYRASVTGIKKKKVIIQDCILT